MLERTAAILPVSHDDIIYKGIAAEVSERIMLLKRTVARLQETYGSLEQLGRKIRAEGVSPDDHTLYTDLLEWQAVNHELTELFHLLESL